jgi:Tol biopolymer transport system component
MSLERHKEVDEILQAALDLAPEERPEFVRKACHQDQALQSAVEALLDSFRKAESENFIEDTPLAGNPGLLAETKADLLSGKLIANYEIQKLLGEGGMGEVYLARDPRLNRLAALKLLSAHLTTNEERVRRFRQEALTASALNHPNIITVYDVGAWNGRDYIATEFVDGVTLREHMSGARLSLATSLEIALQIISALAAAHDAGVTHRDIKPENIMVRPDGLVKVLDFGIAKYTKLDGPLDWQTSLVKTAPGEIIGTVAYMSPEQARGLPVDGRSDIWSLGVILYEMVAQRLPFSGATQSDRLAAILEREPQPVSRLRRGVPPELERIINRALAKKANERYARAADMSADLQEVRDRLGGSGPRRFSLPVPVQRLPASGRPRAFALTALLAFLILAAAVIWLFFLRRTNPEAQPGGVAASSFQNMKLTQLTSSGRAHQAAISPDGNYVVYIKEEAGRQSLWLTHAATDSSKEIAPPLTNEYYAAPIFSPDSNYIYFLKGKRDDVRASLYRIPLLGAEERRLLDDISYQDTLSSFSISPGGERAAFIRLDERFNRSLVVSHLDGGDSRTLVTRTMRQFLSGAVWSPDGKLIATFAGEFGSGGKGRGGSKKVALFDAESGKELEAFPRDWAEVSSLAWLPNSSGVLIAADDGEGLHQLWLLPYPTGEIRRVTNDLSSYHTVSISADSSTIITVQARAPAAISVIQNLATGESSPMTQGVGRRDGQEGLAWVSDEKIAYTSHESGGSEIWLSNADGSEQKQLTNTRDNLFPSGSPDGTTIVFNSTRDNQKSSLWRMDANGGHLARLTEGTYPGFTPDGKWVVYYAGGGLLWKIPSSGGAPTQLTSGPDLTTAPRVSPDGKLIACNYLVRGPNAQFKLGIVSMENGQLLKIFDIKGYAVRPLRWSPDGKAVTYIDTIEGVSNIWAQPVDGGKPRQLTDFRSEQIYYFDWSPKGRLAVARGNATSDVVRIRDFK